MVLVNPSEDEVPNEMLENLRDEPWVGVVMSLNVLDKQVEVAWLWSNRRDASLPKLTGKVLGVQCGRVIHARNGMYCTGILKL